MGGERTTHRSVRSHRVVALKSAVARGAARVLEREAWLARHREGGDRPSEARRGAAASSVGRRTAVGSKARRAQLSWARDRLGAPGRMVVG